MRSAGAGRAGPGGRTRSKNAALVESLTGRFDAHYAELARMLLDQIDALTRQIDTRNCAQRPAHHLMLPAADRLDEITGIGRSGAQGIIAEIGLDMGRFPTPGHLGSWGKVSPRTIQSGPVTRSGRTGKENPYLKGALGEAAASATRTDIFLGERYRRLVKRRGKLKALVAVAGPSW